MNQLIAVAFDHFDDARTAMASLRKLEREGQIRFEDTAVLQVDPDGTPHVKNEVSGTTEAATVVGAFLGAIVTFAFPPLGAVLGAAAGALVGSLMDTGVDPTFVEDVQKQLRPGRSALFLVTKAMHADAVLGALRQFRGDVLQTTLDEDTEEGLRNAIHAR